MTNDERWLKMWHAYDDYLTANKHRPSKYKPEDKKLVNWLKHNRKLRNKGLLAESRLKPLQQLIARAEKYGRVNQYAYVDNEGNKEEQITATQENI